MPAVLTTAADQPTLPTSVVAHARRFYIGGAWVEPHVENLKDVIDPCTTRPIAQVALGRAEDVDAAVRAARRAFATYQLSTREERIALFDRIIAGYKARHRELAEAIAWEIGCPFWFADGYQVGMGLAHFEEARRLLERYRFEYRDGVNVIRREPFGVCALIAAWNWPSQLVTSKVAPALAAGCCAVLKPSELAPLTGVLITEILDEAGVPPGVFNLVNGEGPVVGEAMSAHPDIDLISLTGSKRAGVAIAKAAAETIKAVHLELGGKSANIVWEDADFDVAIPDAVRRGFLNSGQSCIAPTRLLVHESQLERALVIARATAESLTVGPPFAAETKLGPSANAAQFKRVQEMIQVGLDEGATLECGGLGRPDGLEDGYYCRPTIFSHVDPGMRIAQEEIFGPVLVVLTFRDEDEALRIANGTSYGLAGYVSSGDPARAKRIADRMQAGRIFINAAPQNASPPFGGYKESGNGREWGVFGLETFLEVKAVIGADDADPVPIVAGPLPVEFPAPVS